MAIKEGATATNPQTGERVKYQGGQWVPVAAGPRRVSLPEPEAKALQAARDQANRVQYTARRLREFDKLNDKAATGPAYGGPLGQDWLNPINWFRGENLQTMDAINNDLAPQQRQPGSGSTDQIEYRGFKMALPSIEKYGNANRNASRAIYEKDAEAQAYVPFLEQWAQKYGTLSGAETAFDQYWAQRSKKAAPPKKTPQKPAPSGAVRYVYDKNGNLVRGN